MEGKIQRFDFGSLRDFAGPGKFVPLMPIAVEEEAPPPPPAPSFNESELHAARESAREAGYQEGFLAGEAEAKTQIDALHQQSQHAMNSLVTQLGGLDARYAATLAEQSQLISQLALTIARKVAGDALEANVALAIQTLVEQCLPAVLAKPRLIIELHPDTLAVAQSQLADVIASYHYEGEVQFRNNASLGPQDVRIDWESGHASRNMQELWANVEALVSKLPLSLPLADAPTTNHALGEDNG